MAAKKAMSITKATLLKLFSARQYLDRSVQEDLGLRIAFDVYFQDPLFAKNNSDLPAFDRAIVPWEPGMTDGPTTARFAVVDFNGDTGALVPPVEWDEEENCFLASDGAPISEKSFSEDRNALQAHQVHVWAVLQRALDFFESGFGLGRRISWGFEGNRLIVVPHAGYGKNAFYDRESKSLQFYYFDSGQEKIYTCLSADIINHEFAHAVLDGIRPYYIEGINPETAAFHGRPYCHTDRLPKQRISSVHRAQLNGRPRWGYSPQQTCRAVRQRGSRSSLPSHGAK